MTSAVKFPGLAFHVSLRHTGFVLAIVLAHALSTAPALGQTLAVLHDFTGAGDGGNPDAGLTVDAAGNLYGNASIGGAGHGLVFKLTHKNSAWILTPLYVFQGGNDGAMPFGGLSFGPDGALYGTTQYGGGGPCYNGFVGCGTVFKLTPPASICHTTSCPWTETVLYRFQGQPDASYPTSNLIFDQAGNIYGTSNEGGTSGAGTVYELTNSGGNWSESILYSFKGWLGQDGASPRAGVIFDAAGNLYGTTPQGGTGCGSPGCGTVYELSPSQSGWVETLLYNPPGWPNPAFTYGGVIFGPAGILYGTTVGGGSNMVGTVYQLAMRQGAWAATTLYSFPGPYGDGPYAALAKDSAGNFCGTTVEDGSHGCGQVFQFSRSGNNWVFTDLHDFFGFDGCYEYDTVAFDAAGNMYGTSYAGGTYTCFAGGGGCGTVWEITPN